MKKDDIVVEKDELIMKKEMENLKKKLERKKHENIQKVFHTKLNVNDYEQHYDIKHLKEQCNIDDEDEAQEITAARTPIKIISLCL